MLGFIILILLAGSIFRPRPWFGGFFFGPHHHGPMGGPMGGPRGPMGGPRGPMGPGGPGMFF